ncbi:MAG: hypothetical protein QXU32_09175 [Nitrososphaerales archaeon]
MNDYPPLSEYYLYCNACETYFDRWKYDSLEDSGHARCKYVRTLGRDEFLSILSEDKQEGCLKEEFLDNVIQRREQRLAELAEVLCRKRGYRMRVDYNLIE